MTVPSSGRVSPLALAWLCVPTLVKGRMLSESGEVPMAHSYPAIPFSGSSMLQLAEMESCDSWMSMSAPVPSFT